MKIKELQGKKILFFFLFFFGAAPTDCTQDLTPGQQLSIGSVLLGSSWLHDGSLNRPPADGNVVPAETGAPLRRLTTIIPR